MEFVVMFCVCVCVVWKYVYNVCMSGQIHTITLHVIFQGPHYLSTLYVAMVSTVWLLLCSPQNI